MTVVERDDGVLGGASSFGGALLREDRSWRGGWRG